MAGKDKTPVDIDVDLPDKKKSIKENEETTEKGVAATPNPDIFTKIDGKSAKLPTMEEAESAINELLNPKKKTRDIISQTIRNSDLNFGSLKSYFNKDGQKAQSLTRVPSWFARSASTSALMRLQDFHKTTHTRYMTKSLALAYRRTSLLKNIHRSLGNIGNILSRKEDAIKVNTGISAQNALNSSASATGALPSGPLASIQTMLKNKATDYGRGLLKSVIDGKSLADTIHGEKAKITGKLTSLSGFLPDDTKIGKMTSTLADKGRNLLNKIPTDHKLFNKDGFVQSKITSAAAAFNTYAPAWLKDKLLNPNQKKNEPFGADKATRDFFIDWKTNTVNLLTDIRDYLTTGRISRRPISPLVDEKVVETIEDTQTPTEDTESRPSRSKRSRRRRRRNRLQTPKIPTLDKKSLSERLKSYRQRVTDHVSDIRTDPRGIFRSIQSKVDAADRHFTNLIPESVRVKTNDIVDTLNTKIDPHLTREKARVEPYIGSLKEKATEAYAKAWSHLDDNYSDYRSKLDGVRDRAESLYNGTRSKIDPHLDKVYETVRPHVDRATESDAYKSLNKKRDELREKAHDRLRTTRKRVDPFIDRVRDYIDPHIKQGKEIYNDITALSAEERIKYERLRAEELSSKHKMSSSEGTAKRESIWNRIRPKRSSTPKETEPTQSAPPPDQKPPKDKKPKRKSRAESKHQIHEDDPTKQESVTPPRSSRPAGADWLKNHALSKYLYKYRGVVTDKGTSHHDDAPAKRGKDFIDDLFGKVTNLLTESATDKATEKVAGKAGGRFSRLSRKSRIMFKRAIKGKPRIPGAVKEAGFLAKRFKSAIGAAQEATHGIHAGKFFSNLFVKSANSGTDGLTEVVRGVARPATKAAESAAINIGHSAADIAKATASRLKTGGRAAREVFGSRTASLLGKGLAKTGKVVGLTGLGLTKTAIGKVAIPTVKIGTKTLFRTPKIAKDIISSKPAVGAMRGVWELNKSPLRIAGWGIKKSVSGVTKLGKRLGKTGLTSLAMSPVNLTKGLVLGKGKGIFGLGGRLVRKVVTAPFRPFIPGSKPGIFGKTLKLLGRGTKGLIMSPGKALAGGVARHGFSLLGLGKGLVKGVPGLLGDLAIHAGQNYLNQHTEKGSATNILGNAAGTGASWAMTGGMIGSIIPGIGTAAGAAIGGVAGVGYELIKNMSYIKSGFSNFFHFGWGKNAKVDAKGDLKADPKSTFGKLQAGLQTSATNIDAISKGLDPLKDGQAKLGANGLGFIGTAHADDTIGPSSGSASIVRRVSGQMSSAKMGDIKKSSEFIDTYNALPKDIQKRIDDAKNKGLAFTVWSTAVQYGSKKAAEIISDVYKTRTNMSDHDLIDGVFQKRATSMLSTHMRDNAQAALTTANQRSLALDIESGKSNPTYNDLTSSASNPNAVSSEVYERNNNVNNVDLERLTGAVAMAESHGNPNAVSPVGAQGLMQFMPSTYRWMGGKNPFDPQEAWGLGKKYLSQLLNKYRDVPKALAAYNWGPGSLDKDIRALGSAWQSKLPPETSKYIGTVGSNYRLGNIVKLDDVLGHIKKESPADSAVVRGGPADPRVAKGDSPTTPSVVATKPQSAVALQNKATSVSDRGNATGSSTPSIPRAINLPATSIAKNDSSNVVVSQQSSTKDDPHIKDTAQNTAEIVKVLTAIHETLEKTKSQTVSAQSATPIIVNNGHTTVAANPGHSVSFGNGRDRHEHVG